MDLIFVIVIMLKYLVRTATSTMKFPHAIYVDFINIIQPAWDIEWIKVSDEAHHKDT